MAAPWLSATTRFVQGTEVDGVVPKVSGRMVRSQRYKYCVYDTGEHRESLVDMEQDPGEIVNLVRQSAYAVVLQEHRRYLADFAAKTGDSFPAVAPTGGTMRKEIQ